MKHKILITISFCFCVITPLLWAINMARKFGISSEGVVEIYKINLIVGCIVLPLLILAWFKNKHAYLGLLLVASIYPASYLVGYSAPAWFPLSVILFAAAWSTKLTTKAISA
jgi:hypothetical protein